MFYGTLEGYLKAVDAKTGKELYKFKTPSGIIGNVTTYEHGGKQYIAVLSGVGGWAGIGLAAGLSRQTGERGLPDGILERRDGASAQGTDGPDDLPPGGPLDSAPRRVADIAAGSSQPGAVPRTSGCAA